MPVMFLMATIVLYFVGTGFYLAYLVRRSEALSRVSLIITGAGFLSHSIALAARMVAEQQVPLTSSHDAISFFSWALVLVFLIVELRHRIHIFGSFIITLSLISLV
jgi:ABC-type transport system involved in cytochrome c biogenesis permease subunit